MTLSEVLFAADIALQLPYGVFDITWKISHDDKNQKNKRSPPSYFPSNIRSIFLFMYL